MIWLEDRGTKMPAPRRAGGPYGRLSDGAAVSKEVSVRRLAWTWRKCSVSHYEPPADSAADSDQCSSIDWHGQILFVLTETLACRYRMAGAGFFFRSERNFYAADQLVG